MKRKDLAEAMKEIDFCMMTTLDGRGSIYSRPMSNNASLDVEGNTYFFSMEKTKKISNIQETPRVSLSYQGAEGLFIQVYGEGHIIRQKSRMEPYWSEELNAWFQDGLDTAGLVMIRVKAKWIAWWQREKNGRIEAE